MSDNVLEFRGFKGAVEFSADDGLLVGRILDVEALVAFSAETAAEISAAFHEAVDEYLADCERRSVEPEKPYSGSFNVRVKSDLHRRAAREARSSNESLNALVARAISSELDRLDSRRMGEQVGKRMVLRQIAVDQEWADIDEHMAEYPSFDLVAPFVEAAGKRPRAN